MPKTEEDINSPQVYMFSVAQHCFSEVLMCLWTCQLKKVLLVSYFYVHFFLPKVNTGCAKVPASFWQLLENHRIW